MNARTDYIKQEGEQEEKGSQDFEDSIRFVTKGFHNRVISDLTILFCSTVAMMFVGYFFTNLVLIMQLFSSLSAK